jgi:hypothetical protein|tara:strand:- start:4061 stop:4267 length:207 start_codon:yes stop_codon:yes gene_type:complete
VKPSLVIRWDVLATVGAWLIGGMLAYGTLNARISVLEQGYESTHKALAEITGDVKELLQRTVANRRDE